MSSCLQVNTLREYPFAHDSAALPMEAETVFENAGPDELAYLVIKVVQFYSQFFSSEWREVQTSTKIFHPEDLPKEYPPQNQINEFEGILFEQLIQDCEKSLERKGWWRCALSTHYAPEDQLLKAACQAFKELERKIGLFFPTKCRMEIEYSLKTQKLVVTWKGGSAW